MEDLEFDEPLFDFNLPPCPDPPENQPSTSQGHSSQSQFAFGDYVEKEEWNVLKNEKFEHGT